MKEATTKIKENTKHKIEIEKTCIRVNIWFLF